MNDCELLAPAGDYSCMLAAFAAGADAVYLAGKSYGARAFAGNFETEELVEALDYAHLFSKKIYLTLNTLIKEKEFGEIADYLAPFYEHGLDGVIIQDLGLIPFLKREFPQLELHGSTQMTVSNYRSASWLKQQGICRVVPARELSLQELQEIKEKACIEVEAFIHGAMCYSYSGQCLFSSFLGGRSGNRGRCAQPCRLPYKVLENGTCISGKKDVYPLSLKDLCSLPHIYELLDAGIDSFKIEGRMKSPEYVAGVTSVYRKYIDYYKAGRRVPVIKEDMEKLAHLYIRSDMKDGYLKKHNGKDMITFSSPSYQGCDEEVTEAIREQYGLVRNKRKIKGVLSLCADLPAQLQVTCGEVTVTVCGDIVQRAQKHPLTKEDAAKQIKKTGDSDFIFEDLRVILDGNVFMPVKKLNELRRETLESLQKRVLLPYMRKVREVQNSDLKVTKKETPIKAGLYVSVMTKEQLQKVLKMPVSADRIYIPADLFYVKEADIGDVMQMAAEKQIEVYLALPRMIRSRDEAYVKTVMQMLPSFPGVLARSLEGLSFLREAGYKGGVVTDHSVYNWNKSAMYFLQKYRTGFTYPLELSLYENAALEDKTGEYVIYGRTPMMITANCVCRTLDRCTKNRNDFSQSLKDRYQKELPVYVNCVHCYNEIFNAVVMSLHKELEVLQKNGFNTFRMDFSNEEGEEAEMLLSWFLNALRHLKKQEEFPLSEYTLGHFKEGAL